MEEGRDHEYYAQQNIYWDMQESVVEDEEKS